MSSLRIEICKNGHISKQTLVGYFDNSIVEECPICGSNLFHFETVNSEDNPLQVKTYEAHLVNGEPTKIAVYDIASVKGWTRRLVTICGLKFKKFDLKKGQILYQTVDKKYSIRKIVGEEVYLAYKLDNNGLYIWMNDKKFDNREDAANRIIIDIAANNIVEKMEKIENS